MGTGSQWPNPAPPTIPPTKPPEPCEEGQPTAAATLSTEDADLLKRDARLLVEDENLLGMEPPPALEKIAGA